MTHPTRPDREALIGLLLRYNGIPNAGEGDPYYEDAANQVDKFLAALPQAPAPAPADSLTTMVGEMQLLPRKRPAPSPDLLEALEREVLKIFQDNGVIGPGRLESMNPVTRARIAKYGSRLAALASTPPPEAAPAPLREASLGKRIFFAYADWLQPDKVDDDLRGNTKEAFDAGYRAGMAASPARKEADHG